jgi:glyoxylase-like metal-dependent hydrolase (beta-lactamase superfamily II)
MLIRRRDVLRAGAGMAGMVALGGGPARGDDPVAESDMTQLMTKVGSFFSAPVEAQPLGGGLHMVTGPGGNIAALTGPDGLVLVDSGVPNRANDLRDAARKLAGGRPIAVLINTHWHFDHAGGNAAFGKEGAKIWATANTRKRLSTDQYNEAFRVKSPASPPEALPVLTFDEAEAEIGGETVRMVAVPPAHTDGDLVIHFCKADVIHAGDLVTNGGYPNIDASSRGWIGGMVAAADRILAMAGPKTRIIPGHGPLATVDDLRAYRAMLAAIHDRLAAMADAGRSMEDAIRARPTADLDPTWAKGLFNGPMFTRLAYDGLLKHRAAKS